MTGLETLSIDVDGEHQEEKEDLLILGLPKLKYFNGLSLIESDDATPPTSNQLVTTTTTEGPPPAPNTATSSYPTLPCAFPATTLHAPTNPTNPATAATSAGTQALEEADLENAALLFGAVKDLMGTLNPSDDAQLTQAFDDHVKTVIGTLKSKLNNVSDPSFNEGRS